MGKGSKIVGALEHALEAEKRAGQVAGHVVDSSNGVSLALPASVAAERQAAAAATKATTEKIVDQAVHTGRGADGALYAAKPVEGTSGRAHVQAPRHAVEPQAAAKAVDNGINFENVVPRAHHGHDARLSSKPSDMGTRTGDVNVSVNVGGGTPNVTAPVVPPTAARATPKSTAEATIPPHIKARAERMAYLQEHGITPPAAPNIGVNGRSNLLDSWNHSRRVRAFEKEHFGDIKAPQTLRQKASRYALGTAFVAAAASPFADGAGLVEPGRMNPLTLAEHTVFNLPDLITGRDATSPISSMVVNSGKMFTNDYLDRLSKNPRALPDLLLEAASARTKAATEVSAQGSEAAAKRGNQIQETVQRAVDATVNIYGSPKPNTP